MDKRYYFFDLLKFFMAVIIVALHFDYHIVPQGYLMVEGFFILSGFFLMKNLRGIEIQNIDLKKWISKQIKKTYPAYIICILLSALCFPSEFTADMLVKYAFLLNGLGFLDMDASRFSTMTLWYLSVYIWVTFGIIFLCKYVKSHWFIFILAVSVLMSYFVLYTCNPYHAINYTVEIYCFLPVTVFRGIGAVCLGALLPPPENGEWKQKGYLAVGTIGIVVCVSICLLIVSMDVTPSYDYCFIVVFALMVFIFERGGGLINFLCEKIKGFCIVCGKVSLYIYIYHALVIALAREKFPYFVLLLFIIIVFSSVIGCATDWAIKTVGQEIKKIKDGE